MIDDRTPHSNLPLPNAQNLLSEDVERLRIALTAIDEALNSAKQALDSALDEATTEREEAISKAKTDIEKAMASLKDAVNQQLLESGQQLKKTHTLALAGL